MNCWFCHQPFKPPYCESQSCRSHYVTYIFHERHNSESMRFELYKVQFKTVLFNAEYKSRDYYINYYPPQKHIEVVERITPSFDPESESPWIAYDFNTVLKLPYQEPTLPLTPANVNAKLPLLFLLS